MTGWAEKWIPVPLTTKVQNIAGVTGGEGFQMVMAIVYAPSNPNIVYAGSDTSQVWKSMDGGRNWKKPANSGFDANGARSLFVYPKNENLVLAAGFLGAERVRIRDDANPRQGIFRTDNGGHSWEFVHNTAFYKQDSTGELFVADSRTNNRHQIKVYAGTYAAGLIQSDDGGMTWDQVGFNDGHIIDIEELPGEPGTLIIATDTGLFRFRDGQYSKIGSGLAAPPLSISVSLAAPKMVFAAVGRFGVFISADKGLNFVRQSTGLPYQVVASDISVSPVDAKKAILGTHRTGNSPYYSVNGGQSWHKTKTVNERGLTDGGGFFFSSPFTFHPTNSDIALSASNGRSRILKTENGGASWFYSGSGYRGGRVRDISFQGKGSMILALTDHGLWRTNDQGDTFEPLRAPSWKGQSVRSVAESNETIVASIGSWKTKILVISWNDGQTWTVAQGLVGQFRFLSFHPQDQAVIYAGRYRSDNRGRTWKELRYEVSALAPSNGDFIYAFSKNHSAVMRSEDRGETWSFYTSAPIRGKFNATLVDPLDKDRLFFASGTGVYILEGKKWILRDERQGLRKDSHGTKYIAEMAINPLDPNIIYVGKRSPGRGMSNGIFRSWNGGINWESISFNLGANINIWSISCDPSDGSVYIGTSHGLYKLEAK